MTRSGEPSSDRSPTRRRFLAGAGTALLVGGVGRASAAQDEEVVSPTVIVPVVEEFEGNYVGQFLTLRSESTNAGDLEDVKNSCQGLPWPEGEAQQIVGQVTDRRSDQPVAVRLPVYIDGRQRPERDDALYIISRASACEDQFVHLQLSPVDLRNIAGGPPGPSADEGAGDGGGTTDGIGAGPGLLAGAVGGLGAVLARALRNDGSSND